jgi:hypothetical protein
MTYYVGGEISLNDILGEGNPRFFYGLRRDDDGALFFSKIDQLRDTGSVITLNVPGSNANNFEQFEYGIDFFDGRLAADHSRPYPNLVFDQYRFDGKDSYYYINANGELVVRVNRAYQYTQDQIVS